MNDQNVLSIGFMEREPRSAARALEEIEAIDAAAFLDRVPFRLAAPVVAAMGPWPAARCVEHMGRDAASALVMAMPHVDAVSVLRLVNGHVREDILRHATERFTRSFRHAVAYRKDTVGAWMDISVPSFDADATVKDTLRALRRAGLLQSHLFVTGPDRQYSGVVAVSDLIRHDDSAFLSDVTDRSIRPLSNQSPLANCSTNPGWDTLNILPVVGRKQNLLGGLSRTDLRKGLAEPVTTDRVLDSGSMVVQIASAFVAVAVECANLALSADSPSHHARTKE
jgi:Mg/Co/Ni transporter MgtE